MNLILDGVHTDTTRARQVPRLLGISNDPTPREPRLVRGDERQWAVTILIPLSADQKVIISIGVPREVQCG